jgi:fatty acid amide hydrolase
VAWWGQDGYFQAAPAVERATREASEQLAAGGVQVVAAEPPDIERAMRLFLGLVSADGLSWMRDLARHSKIDWEVRRQMWLGRLGSRSRWALGKLLSWTGQPTLGKLLASTGPRTPYEIEALETEAQSYRQAFWDALETATGGPVDAVLTPPHSLAALKHGSGLDLLPAASYTYLPNLLGVPAGVVPWTTVRNDEQHEPRSKRDLSQFRALRNTATSAGLMVGVQVFAREWREDIVLALLKTLKA